MASRAIWGAGLGQGLSWGSLTYTSTPFNSLAANNVVTNLSAITNGTALDIYADLSFTFVNGATTTTAASQAQLFLLPLNQDASTYGDNSQTLGAASSTIPAAQYQVGAVNHKVSVASGTALVGMFRGIILPPGSFVFCILPNTNGALNATASATIAYRTYIENLNG